MDGMTKEAKKERRQMRRELYKEAKSALSLETRMTMTPAQLKQACRVLTDRAISTVVNA